jgi:hypothetical protein
VDVHPYFPGRKCAFQLHRAIRIDKPSRLLLSRKRLRVNVSGLWH